MLFYGHYNMLINPAKCYSMDITFAKNPVPSDPLQLAGQELQSSEVCKILGIKVANNLKWDIHINDIICKASGRLFMLTTLRRFGLAIKDLVTIYVGFIRPLLEYAVPAWHPGLTTKQHNSLERIQKRACRIILANDCDS